MRTSLKALGFISALFLTPLAASPLYAEESQGSSGSMGDMMNDQSHGSSGSMMGGTMSNDNTASMMNMMKMMMEMNQNMMNMMTMMEKMNSEKMSAGRNTGKGMMNDESHNAPGSMMGGTVSNDSTDGMKMGVGKMSKMMDACGKIMESRADRPEQSPKEE